MLSPAGAGLAGTASRIACSSLSASMRSEKRRWRAAVRAHADPVVALNRAVALAEVRGPAAGLAAVDELCTSGGGLDGYYPRGQEDEATEVTDTRGPSGSARSASPRSQASITSS